MKYTKFLIGLMLLSISSAKIFSATSGAGLTDKQLKKLPNVARFNVRFINKAEGNIKVTVKSSTPFVGRRSVVIPQGQKGYVVASPCLHGTRSIIINGVSGKIDGKGLIKDFNMKSQCYWGGLYVTVSSNADGSLKIDKITNLKGKSVKSGPSW